MARLDLSAISSKLDRLVERVKEDKQTAVVAGAAVVLGGALAWRAFSGGSSSYKKKPSVFDLSGGSIDRENVKNEWDNYEASYGKEAGVGIKDRSKVTQLVDVFYSLVTDIYEWGWGQSFHFSPKLPGKTWAASEAAHEARVAAALGLKPGMRCLDVGCGVGGPMRTIAAVSGAHVTGITINQYQVRGKGGLGMQRLGTGWRQTGARARDAKRQTGRANSTRSGAPPPQQRRQHAAAAGHSAPRPKAAPVPHRPHTLALRPKQAMPRTASPRAPPRSHTAKPRPPSPLPPPPGRPRDRAQRQERPVRDHVRRARQLPGDAL
jgi:hypothetical protein